LELCCFVLGSKAKQQVSIFHNNFVKKIMSASAIAVMSLQDVTLSSLCSGVKGCETKHAHNFLFPKSSFTIWRTTVLGMFEDSIILDVIGQSLLTKSATAAMFTSVWVDFGGPPFSSSSTSFLMSQNREYHLKTFDQFTASFPYAFCTNTSVLVADRPALKQNFMATLCSRLPSMTYKDNWLYKTSYNSYTVKDKQMILGMWTDVVW
jgi:hypothetical protein